MQGNLKPYPTLAETTTHSDDSAHYTEMPNSAELQRSPPIHPLRTPGPIPVSPAGPLPELAEGSKPIAIQYAMMLKAQSDREAAIAFREAAEAERKANKLDKKKKSGCTLF